MVDATPLSTLIELHARFEKLFVERPGEVAKVKDAMKRRDALRRGMEQAEEELKRII